jgi:hypothetical protein
MPRTELKTLPTTKPLRLHNVICPYCGLSLTKANSTKEHVVGRRFVPKGTLDNEWNLILNACRSCNNRKADLENDISAITMQPNVLGEHFGDHPQLASEAARKTQRSHSRYTGKPVEDSWPTIEIKGELMPGVTVTFNMVGQQQIDNSRAYELALRHFQAFFFYITYNHQEERGWWWKGSYAPIQAVSKNDWGNDVALAFMEKTRSWATRILLTGVAAGHFMLAIRKHPEQDIWSLAVEWNENYRVIAACGEEEPVKLFLKSLPEAMWVIVSQSPNSIVRKRTEQGLKTEDDTLFVGHVEPARAAPLGSDL